LGQDFPYDPASMSGVGNLSDKDPVIQELAKLPISPAVAYHSIIGKEKAADPLEDSSDGIVPYWSAHLEGAADETVIHSGHSVQETPQAILKIRSILREHLAGVKSKIRERDDQEEPGRALPLKARKGRRAAKR
ncbi:MAG: hypothetical protein HUK26_09110, partial [Duodenibacillus sp.]|nr:hypothetical protein [Duodenibacillus sp.]